MIGPPWLNLFNVTLPATLAPGPTISLLTASAATKRRRPAVSALSGSSRGHRQGRGALRQPHAPLLRLGFDACSTRANAERPGDLGTRQDRDRVSVLGRDQRELHVLKSRIRYHRNRVCRGRSSVLSARPQLNGPGRLRCTCPNDERSLDKKVHKLALVAKLDLLVHGVPSADVQTPSGGRWR